MKPEMKTAILVIQKAFAWQYDIFKGNKWQLTLCLEYTQGNRELKVYKVLLKQRKRKRSNKLYLEKIII